MEQYEINWKDYYSVLGVSSAAEPEVVKAAYNALAKKYHPDAGGNVQRMKEINEGYEVLSSPTRKVHYDVFRQHRKTTSSRSSYGETDHSSADGHSGQDPRESNRRSRRQAPSYAAEVPAVFPWLSWRWQRAALFSSIPLGVALVMVNLSFWTTLAGLFILAVAIYATARTRGLRRVEETWTMARVSAGFCIVSSLCVLGTTVLVLALVFLIIMSIVAIIKATLA